MVEKGDLVLPGGATHRYGKSRVRGVDPVLAGVGGGTAVAEASTSTELRLTIVGRRYQTLPADPDKKEKRSQSDGAPALVWVWCRGTDTLQ